MKAFKRVLSAVLAFTMLITVFSFAVSAKQSESTVPGKNIVNPENPVNKYPYVLVHGIFGWGESNNEKMGTTYWGFNKEKNIADDLRDWGYEVYTATVGPASSAWDRACELYAQLTGTVVDYGEAHSKQYGHKRFGRDYSDNPLMGHPWDIENEKINLITHSFGGATAIVFTSMLEKGVEEEIAASGENVSKLFAGGHGGAVFSCTTGSSPSNGTPLANIFNDTVAPIFALGFALNVMGATKLLYDPMLDHWGLSADPQSGKRAHINPIGLVKIVKSKDHAAYDMTLRGAKELIERFPTASQTYWLSSTCTTTENDENGVPRVTKNTTGTTIFIVTGGLISMCYGKTVDGVKMDENWAKSDGFVPLASAQCPFGAKHEDYNGQKLNPGVWYVLENVQSPKGHGFHNSYGKTEELQKPTFDFYRTVFEIVEAI